MELSSKFERIVLLSDHASVPLAEEIYKHLSKKQLYGELHKFNPDDLYLNRFNNGECEVRVKAKVRGRSVFVVKSFNTIQRKFPYNYKTESWIEKPKLSDFVMDTDKGYFELFAINDALRLSSASSITDILMFMPYLRQDKKDKEGVPVTAKLAAKLIESSRASRVITFYPHFEQLIGFFDKAQLEILNSNIFFADWLIDNYKKEELIASATDANSSEKVKNLANALGIPYGTATKSRPAPGEIEDTRIFCNESLEGKVVAIYDDIIDTAGSLFRCAEYAKKNGAREVLACMAHPVLSCDAKQRLLENEIKLITTDSIIIPDREKYPNITVLSLGYLISETIGCITSGEPISSYLNNFEEFRKVKKANGL